MASPNEYKKKGQAPKDGKGPGRKGEMPEGQKGNPGGSYRRRPQAGNS